MPAWGDSAQAQVLWTSLDRHLDPEFVSALAAQGQSSNVAEGVCLLLFSFGLGQVFFR